MDEESTEIYGGIDSIVGPGANSILAESAQVPVVNRAPHRKEQPDRAFPSAQKKAGPEGPALYFSA